MHGEALAHWLPFKLTTEEDVHLCRWMFVGNKRFTEPFFDETILWCKYFEENKKFFKPTSSLEMLPLWSSAIKAVQPTCFIFHVSRCGSTLLSQLLALDPRHIVLSEVPLLDELLRLPFNKIKIDVEESNQYFTEAIRFCGQKKNEDESHLFIKLDSWHLLFFDRIRSLYPDVPFVILYRSPAEIIRSQQRARGMQSVPGLIEKEIFGFTESDFSADLDLYMSRVLEKYFAQIIQIMKTDTNLLLADYDEGILDVTHRLLSIVGIQPSEEYSKKMEDRMQFDAKRGSLFFKTEEVANKDALFLQTCQSLYQQVQELRSSLNPLQNKLHQQV